MSTKPPLIVTAALVLPAGMLELDIPAEGTPMAGVVPTSLMRCSIELVLAQERAIGRVPEVQASNTPGYDILSTDIQSGETYRIKVIAHVLGASNFWVTHNEVVTGKNAKPRYRLALVRIDADASEGGEVRYLEDPFANVEMDNFQATGHAADWNRGWMRGKAPF